MYFLMACFALCRVLALLISVGAAFQTLGQSPMKLEHAFFDFALTTSLFSPSLHLFSKPSNVLQTGLFKGALFKDQGQDSPISLIAVSLLADVLIEKVSVKD